MVHMASLLVTGIGEDGRMGMRRKRGGYVILASVVKLSLPGIAHQSILAD